MTNATSNRKLSFRKTTLRRLNDDEARLVHGGQLGDSYACLTDAVEQAGTLIGTGPIKK